MKNNLKNGLIALGVLALIIITGAGVNFWKERQFAKTIAERTQAETIITQKGIEAKKVKQQLDSTNLLISQKQTLIDYLEKNPQIIIQNNDKIHMDISRLNAYNSIVRFTDNVSKYASGGNRYDLHRFDKHN